MMSAMNPMNPIGGSAIPGLKVPNNVTFTELSLYVGDLDPNITDMSLAEFFIGRYPSLVGAKVIVDGSSRISKGYGFVKFGRNDEYQRALLEMPGQMLMSRPMKIKQTHARSQTGSETNMLASILALNSLSNPTSGEMNNPANPILNFLSSTLSSNNSGVSQMQQGNNALMPLMDPNQAGGFLGGASAGSLMGDLLGNKTVENESTDNMIPNIPLASLPPHLQEYYTALAYTKSLNQPKKEQKPEFTGLQVRENYLLEQEPQLAYFEEQFNSYK